jgi:hypothetical protein
VVAEEEEADSPRESRRLGHATKPTRRPVRTRVVIHRWARSASRPTTIDAKTDKPGCPPGGSWPAGAVWAAVFGSATSSSPPWSDTPPNPRRCPGLENRHE